MKRIPAVFTSIVSCIILLPFDHRGLESGGGEHHQPLFDLNVYPSMQSSSWNETGGDDALGVVAGAGWLLGKTVCTVCSDSFDRMFQQFYLLYKGQYLIAAT